MPVLLTLLMLGCLLVGAALALGALSDVRHALLLWRARRVSAGAIDHAGASVVDVRGRVHADEPLSSPLSAQRCVQWQLVVSRAPVKPGQHKDGLSDVLVLHEARPFWVDDGTGRVRVAVQGRSIPLSEVRSTSQPLVKLTPALDALLSARLPVPPAAWCHQREVSAVESALFVGDEVSLIARRELRARLSIEPVHVTLGRPRVVAMRLAMRAAVVAGFAGIFLAVAQWLR